MPIPIRVQTNNVSPPLDFQTNKCITPYKYVAIVIITTSLVIVAITNIFTVIITITTITTSTLSLLQYKTAFTDRHSQTDLNDRTPRQPSMTSLVKFFPTEDKGQLGWIPGIEKSFKFFSISELERGFSLATNLSET